MCFSKQSNFAQSHFPHYSWHQMNSARVMSNYSIFCFPFSVQCVASFLIYCALLSPAVKTELLTSLWPFLQGSELQFFTNGNAFTFTTPQDEVLLLFSFYCWVQTVRWWPKTFTNFRSPTYDSDPWQHPMCCNHSSPQLVAAPRDQNSEPLIRHGGKKQHIMTGFLWTVGPTWLCHITQKLLAEAVMQFQSFGAPLTVRLFFAFLKCLRKVRDSWVLTASCSDGHTPFCHFSGASLW